MNDATRIQEPKIKRDASGNITHVSFAFGPHYFVQVNIEDGKAHLAFGATHHGIRSDASEVNGQLEQIMNKLMQQYPELAF